MTQIEYETTLIVTSGPTDTDADVTAEVDRVMSELICLQQSGVQIDDPAVSLDLATGCVEFELIAHGDDFDDAYRVALSSIRSAIHAAGGRTPGWSWEEQSRNTHTEPVSDRPLLDA